MKKLFWKAGIVAVLSAALIAPMTTYASTVTGVHNESVVNIVGSWIMRLLFRNTNNATINNNVTTTANTGRNEVESVDDQSGTTILTGAAYTAGSVENEANNNFTSIDAESPDGTDDTVTDTADESAVNISTEDTIGTDIENENNADANNDINTNSNSGENKVKSDDELKTVLVNTGASGSGSGVSNLFNIDVFSLIRRMRTRP